MKLKLAVSLLLVAVLLFSFGCAAKVDVDAVRSYADSMTENLLIGMNNKNYAVFSRDFDETMKKALPEPKFSDLIAQINGKIGSYVPNSKEFERAYKTGNFVNVVYKAKFTEESSPVTVRVVFSEVNGEHKISGIWFDSPKLRKK
jgi:hypothetical protein